MCTLDVIHGYSSEVVIVGRTGAEDTLAMLRSLHRNFIPNKVVLFRPAEVNSPEILNSAPSQADDSYRGKINSLCLFNLPLLGSPPRTTKMLALLEKS